MLLQRLARLLRVDTYVVTATAGRDDDPWIVWESGISAIFCDPFVV